MGNNPELSFDNFSGKAKPGKFYYMYVTLAVSYTKSLRLDLRIGMLNGEKARDINKSLNSNPWPSSSSISTGLPSTAVRMLIHVKSIT